jgi:hypothetical protein
MQREYARDEFTTLTHSAFGVWSFLIRYVVPPALAGDLHHGRQ